MSVEMCLFFSINTSLVTKPHISDECSKEKTTELLLLAKYHDKWIFSSKSKIAEKKKQVKYFSHQMTHFLFFLHTSTALSQSY